MILQVDHIFRWHICSCKRCLCCWLRCPPVPHPPHGRDRKRFEDKNHLILPESQWFLMAMLARHAMSAAELETNVNEERVLIDLLTAKTIITST
jgi:hypothetical protein